MVSRRLGQESRSTQGFSTHSLDLMSSRRYRWTYPGEFSYMIETRVSRTDNTCTWVGFLRTSHSLDQSMEASALRHQTHVEFKLPHLHISRSGWRKFRKWQWLTLNFETDSAQSEGVVQPANGHTIAAREEDHSKGQLLSGLSRLRPIHHSSNL